MTIAGLQKHFRDLGEFVAQTAAGSKATADLTAIADALDPFRSLALDQFAGFLRTAEEYHRTGVLPIPPTKAKRGAKSATATPAAPKVDPNEAANRVIALYHRAADSALTTEAMEEELKQVDALKGKAMADVLKALGLVKGKKAVDVLKQEIRTAIRNRHAMPARTQI